MNTSKPHRQWVVVIGLSIMATSTPVKAETGTMPKETQTNALLPAEPPASAAPISSAEEEMNLRRRFHLGLELFQKGKLTEALALFEQNIAANPQARGSLLMVGIIYNERFEPARALRYLVPFRELEPAHEGALLQTIRSFSGVKNSAKVRELIEELRQRRLNSPTLQALRSFERERVRHPEGGFISILEIFDSEDPVRWQFLLSNSRRQIVRLLEYARTDSHWVLRDVLSTTDGESPAFREIERRDAPVDWSVVRAWALNLLLNTKP